MTVYSDNVNGLKLETMYDTIGRDAGNIPAAARKVAGYVTGTSDIIWPEAAWRRFPDAGRVRVDQSATGERYAGGWADVFDMEYLAGTPARFAGMAAARHDRKQANCGYGSHSTLELAAAALDAQPGRADGWWHGAVSCWLADPNLSLAEASNLIGTILYRGFVVVAVQWATPKTNPTTPVDGGTLQSLNLDLSVADAAWIPGPQEVPWQDKALLLSQQINTTIKTLGILTESLTELLEKHK